MMIKGRTLGFVHMNSITCELKKRESVWMLIFNSPLGSMHGKLFPTV